MLLIASAANPVRGAGGKVDITVELATVAQGKLAPATEVAASIPVTTLP